MDHSSFSETTFIFKGNVSETTLHVSVLTSFLTVHINVLWQTQQLGDNDMIVIIMTV